MSSKQIVSKNYLPGIDVLRGTAALGVGWFHSRVDLWVGFRAIQANPEDFSGFDRFISYFSLPASQIGGVILLFFVLSGFCIHLPLVGKTSHINWSAFYVRRFFRIYPAYFVTLLFCLTAYLIFFSQKVTFVSELSLYASSAAMLQNLISNARQIQLNPSLWTIPIEVEAYIIYPLLLLFWHKKGFQGALILTLIFSALSIALYAGGHESVSASFLKFAVIWNSGAWLAEIYRLGRLPKWSHSLTLILAAITIFTMGAGFLGIEGFYLHYGWGLSSILLLIWVLGPGKLIFTIDKLWVKPLVFIGKISYSYFLIHFPIFKLAGLAWIWLYGSKPESFLVPTVATLLVIPLSWVFFYFIEQPTHQLAKKLSFISAGVD